jgi:hypothetical protein
VQQVILNKLVKEKQKESANSGLKLVKPQNNGKKGAKK